MIQFNLLPDVKQNFLKAQRTKRLAITISFFCAAAALAIMIIMLVLVYGVQKKSLNDLKRDTTKYSNQVTSTPDLNKVLTIQNQLTVLPGIYNQRPDVNNLFTYLAQTTPNNASISSLALNFSVHTWAINGNADSLSTVDQLVDTYKFTTFTNGSSSSDAFSNVVLISYSQNPTGGNSSISYSISMSFDPAIFDSTKNITLTVPTQITTRSVTQLPQLLFNGSSTTNKNNGT